MEDLTEDQSMDGCAWRALAARITMRRIPNDQRTPEVCLAAVKQKGEAIKYLTAEQLTYLD